MTATHVQLTDLTTATTGQTTTMSGDGIELGAFGRLTVTVKRAVGAEADSGSYLVLQTSYSKGSNYTDLSPPIDLTRTGTLTRHYLNGARYIRWAAVVSGSTSAQFSIDILARSS